MANCEPQALGDDFEVDSGRYQMGDVGPAQTVQRQRRVKPGLLTQPGGACPGALTRPG